LADRAYALVAGRGPASEADLLEYVYGGRSPESVRQALIAPLVRDPRLERHADGTWTVRGRDQNLDRAGLADVAVTTLALAATGPNPSRARIVHVALGHVQPGDGSERFMVTVNPGRRVPRYVVDRIGVGLDTLDGMPPFETVLDELLAFIDPEARPILAQDADLTWAFLEAEARRAHRALPLPLLIDANELASRALRLTDKPTISRVADRLGVSWLRIDRPDEEARILGQVLLRLLAEAAGALAFRELLTDRTRQRSDALRRADTAARLAETPGVYILRDRAERPLYVGKARHLRRRVEAYIHRPLGATRRLEGLVDTVDAVDPTTCATDLEALVLESRQIQQLQPRFNTARQQHLARLWIRLPPLLEDQPGKRNRRPRRLELSVGPDQDSGEFVGPFRNETVAESCRHLARQVFELDQLRLADPGPYATRLDLAWRFLSGEVQVAEPLARARSVRLLRAVLDASIPELLLPADPRLACYAVIRRSDGGGLEGLRIDRGIFCGYAVATDDWSAVARQLLVPAAPRTELADVPVVLRWLGAQRPPASRLVLIDPDPLVAADALEVATRSVVADWARESGSPGSEHSLDTLC
jgi:DNA polymerase-3 subunit epsilon